MSRRLSDPLLRPDVLAEQLPKWAHWNRSMPYSLGVEEETMLLDPDTWGLTRNTEAVLAGLPVGLASRTSTETHDSVLEIGTRPHLDITGIDDELRGLRRSLRREMNDLDLQVAAAGTHPMVTWEDVEVSGGSRYQLILESMRCLARREPTFALHVHVGVADGPSALTLLNRMRAHLPLLLALSANSPFWQGRDSGMASMRTSIFQAFPRVGIPLSFNSYAEYVEMIDQLLRCGAIPDPSFLWWDVRLRPRFGTLEVRVMDAQSNVERSVALAALVQSIAHLELEEGYHDASLIYAQEILNENRFLAARDGMDARLIDPVSESLVPASEQLAQLMAAVQPHAEELGAQDALSLIPAIARDTGAQQQRRLARMTELERVIQILAATF